MASLTASMLVGGLSIQDRQRLAHLLAAGLARSLGQPRPDQPGSRLDNVDHAASESSDCPVDGQNGGAE